MNKDGEKQVLAVLKTTLQNIGGELGIKYTYYTYEEGVLKSNNVTIENTSGISDAVTKLRTVSKL